MTDMMNVMYVKGQDHSAALDHLGSTIEHRERRTLRVRTSLPEIRTGEPMRMALTETMPIPYDAKIRHIGNLEQESLFDLTQILSEFEQDMYSRRVP